MTSIADDVCLNQKTISSNCFNYQRYVFYISTSIWVLHTPNEGWNMHFQCFFCKKAEKGRKAKKLRQNLSKNLVFALFCSNCFWLFWSTEIERVLLSDHCSISKPQWLKLFLLLSFLSFFLSTKKCLNPDIDQSIGCAAPKPWSKYTTDKTLWVLS